MHGGDVYGYFRKHGSKPLDFSASISPFGVPEEVRRAVAEAMEVCGRYPDPECVALREALAEDFEKAEPGDILCGAGASDLIYRYVCATRPKRALIITPAFSEYERALRLYGCDVREHALSEDNGFALSHDILDDITDDTDLLILNFPHNPTGLIPDAGLVEAVIKKCESLGVYILSDECFMDFVCDTAESEASGRFFYPSLFGCGYDRIMVIRAFTKYHGLAGLRLGYALSRDHGMLTRMHEAGPPWSVSTPAQAAGMAVLRDAGYYGEIRRLIANEREYLYDELKNLGFRVIPGQANFLLFYTDDTSLGRRLSDRGILIRDCSDFTGLCRGWYRVAVRTHEENEQLIGEMRDDRHI